MDFTVGYYQAPGSDSFQPSVGWKRLRCLKVFLDPALLTTCLIKLELRAEANKFFISICQPFPSHRFWVGWSLWFHSGLIPRGTLRVAYCRDKQRLGRMDCESSYLHCRMPCRSTRRGNEDSSRQSYEQASGLPDKETFDMQVRTPFPWLHVGSRDDH